MVMCVIRLSFCVINCHEKIVPKKHKSQRYRLRGNPHVRKVRSGVHRNLRLDLCALLKQFICVYEKRLIKYLMQPLQIKK